MKVEDLKEKLSAGEDFLLLDVREGEEVAEDPMIEGSKHMPMGKVFVEASKGNIPKDKPVVLVCKSGGRCAIVARELAAKGFDVDYLEGGIKEWKKRTQ